MDAPEQQVQPLVERVADREQTRFHCKKIHTPAAVTPNVRRQRAKAVVAKQRLVQPCKIRRDRQPFERVHVLSPLVVLQRYRTARCVAHGVISPWLLGREKVPHEVLQLQAARPRRLLPVAGAQVRPDVIRTHRGLDVGPVGRHPVRVHNRRDSVELPDHQPRPLADSLRHLVLRRRGRALVVRRRGQVHNLSPPASRRGRQRALVKFSSRSRRVRTLDIQIAQQSRVQVEIFGGRALVRRVHEHVRPRALRVDAREVHEARVVDRKRNRVGIDQRLRAAPRNTRRCQPPELGPNAGAARGERRAHPRMCEMSTPSLPNQSAIALTRPKFRARSLSSSSPSRS